MSKLIALGGLLVITMLAFVACSNGATSNIEIQATWITPQDEGDTVSISASEIERSR
jgi:hypothetical protein